MYPRKPLKPKPKPKPKPARAGTKARARAAPAPKPKSAVERAVEMLAVEWREGRPYGGQTALARACGVTQAHVWQWLRRGLVPAERVLAIYQATGGRIAPFEIRPDLYPDPTWLPPLENPYEPERTAADSDDDAPVAYAL
jgi:DNA-binding transcriptional regulator YdaS (Cro superfamily)